MIPAIAVILGSIGLAAFVIFLKIQYEKNRTKRMQQQADTLGLSFFEKDVFGLKEQLKTFEIFRRERSYFRGNSRISNVFKSKVGNTDVYLFEYSYIISTGKSSRRVYRTVFFADDKNWSLPKFKLEPESWWHKLGRSMGISSDIEIENSPDFSKKFWINGDLEKLIKEKFSPEIQDLLLAENPIRLEAENYYLLAYKKRRRMSPEASAAFFQECCKLVELLKGNQKEALLDLTEPVIVNRMMNDE